MQVVFVKDYAVPLATGLQKAGGGHRGALDSRLRGKDAGLLPAREGRWIPACAGKTLDSRLRGKDEKSDKSPFGLIVQSESQDLLQ